MDIREELKKGWEHHQAGRFEEAQQIYRAIIEFKPDQSDALQLMGQLAQNAGQSEIAAVLYERSLRANPNQPLVMVNLAMVLTDLRDLPTAIKWLNVALEIVPDMPQAHIHMGAAQMMQNQIDEAAVSFTKAAEKDPRAAEAFRLLTMISDVDKKNPVRKKLEELGKNQGLPQQEQLHIHYALANQYKREGNDKKYWAELKEANALHYGLSRITMEDTRQQFIANKASVTGKIPENTGEGTYPFTPIFIVGLPRSGTTLVEQILASHSAVFGGDELNTMHTVVPAFVVDYFQRNPGKKIEDWQEEDRAYIANSYLGPVSKLAPNSAYITDKFPANFLKVGLIRNLLPFAKVIDLRRDPMDNGLSIYENFFPKPVPYLTNLADIGEYTRLYVDIMNYWDDLYPGFVHHITYEDLISNQEEETRKLLEFCGLPFENACLDFHKTDRDVRTNSVTQVRSPIYSSSVGRWKKFEKELKPMKDALGDLVKTK